MTSYHGHERRARPFLRELVEEYAPLHGEALLREVRGVPVFIDGDELRDLRRRGGGIIYADSPTRVLPLEPDEIRASLNLEREPDA